MEMMTIWEWTSRQIIMDFISLSITKKVILFQALQPLDHGIKLIMVNQMSSQVPDQRGRLEKLQNLLSPRLLLSRTLRRRQNNLILNLSAREIQLLADVDHSPRNLTKLHLKIRVCRKQRI